MTDVESSTGRGARTRFNIIKTENPLEFGMLGSDAVGQVDYLLEVLLAVITAVVSTPHST